MNKQIYSLIFLHASLFMSMSSSAMDDMERYNGMQLAWSRLSPEGEVEKKKSAPAKANPAKAKAAKTPPPAKTVKPVPITKPVPAPAAEVKSVAPATPAPVLKTEPVPATVPAVKQAPATAIKPVMRPPVSARPRTVNQEEAAFHWVLGAGLDVGGDELGVLTYSDGTTASAKANMGLLFYVGGMIPNDEEGTFATQLSVGYKTGGPRIWSSDVNWSAIPIEVIEFYRVSDMHMGLGISYQLNPRLRVNVPNASFTTNYKNAIGVIAQIGWAPAREHYSIDLRYTGISFAESDVADAPLINGNVGGLYLNYYY